ncbi:MAG: nickel pincer cofactor biosynthesis protein LarB [Thermoplasmata archaeon]|nr:MAG: nickel pincer cofactor biosynthesis protein LarB [Thermoplasmata archaeon]
MQIDLKELLQKYKNGKISAEEIEKKIKQEKILFVKKHTVVDLERDYRCGIPEVILGEGKKDEQVIDIVKDLLRKRGKVIITRTKKNLSNKLQKIFSDRYNVDFYDIAKICVIKDKKLSEKREKTIIGIITAGTSDIPVAEEARITIEELGFRTIKAYDVGVAGLHRVLDPLKEMIEKGVKIFIVVAGREGTLPGLVAGMVDGVVIGVPVSTGYGYGGKGEAALKAMLQSCASIAVVNIDAGFVAGVLAVKIAKIIGKAEK